MPRRCPLSLFAPLAVLTLTLVADVQGQCQPSPSQYLDAAHGESRDIFSPNYPSPYDDNSDCRWVISAEPDYLVQLQIISIDLETTGDCAYDFIEVFNGASDARSAIIKFCAKPEQNIVSSGHTLYVKFTSDSSETKRGFHLSYKAVQKGEVYQCSRDSVMRLSAGPFQQNIYSPQYYSHGYSNSMWCSWLIETSNPGHVIKLNVIVVELEYTPRCDADYIVVYDGDSDTATEIEHFCQHPHRDIYSQGQSMLVRFVSDGSVTGKGFYLQYSAIQQSHQYCGSPSHPEQLWASSDSEQYIYSPHYPNNYAHNSNCVWIITADVSWERVVLRVGNMELDNAADCSRDYIAVYDGNSDSDTLLERFCYNYGQEISSSGRYLYVRFVSDGSGNRAGFRLAYQAVQYSHTTTTESYCADCKGPVNVGAIIGGVFSFVVLFVIISMACYMSRCRHTSQRPQSVTTTPHTVPHTVYQNNTVYMVPTAPPQTVASYQPSMMTGATNQAYSPTYCGPPPYISLDHSATTLPPSQPDQVSATTPLPTDAPPPYEDAMKLAYPPVPATTE